MIRSRQGCLTWNQIFLPYEILGGCPVLKQTLNSVEALYVCVPVHSLSFPRAFAADLTVREKQRPLPEHTCSTLTNSSTRSSRFPRCCCASGELRQTHTGSLLLLCTACDGRNITRHAGQSGGRESYFNKCADKVFIVRCGTVPLQLYATTGGMLGMWTVKTHASGAEHQLSVLYQSVCVFNSRPVLFVNLHVCVWPCDDRKCFGVSLWMCAISDPGLSVCGLHYVVLRTAWYCCYDLHFNEYLLKKETINKHKKKRLLSLTLVIVYTDTPVRNIKAVIYYTKRLSFSVNT